MDDTLRAKIEDLRRWAASKVPWAESRLAEASIQLAPALADAYDAAMVEIERLRGIIDRTNGRFWKAAGLAQQYKTEVNAAQATIVRLRETQKEMLLALNWNPDDTDIDPVEWCKATTRRRVQIKSLRAERDAALATIAERDAEIARLREVLRPFAGYYKRHQAWFDGCPQIAVLADPHVGHMGEFPTSGDCRRAADALKGANRDE